MSRASVVAAVAVVAALGVVALLAVTQLQSSADSASSSDAASPLVSVMVVTYNRHAFLPHAVKAILSQDYTNLEVVIVDDSAMPWPEAAPDAAAAVLADSRVKYMHQTERLSVGAKRNLAVQAASGEYVVTWDDDDMYHSSRISAQVAALQSGEVGMTTLSHGLYLYLYQDMAFKRWKLEQGDVGSPHFGTLAFARSVFAQGGIRYADTSMGEDYSFVEHALDAGFTHRNLANQDRFVYVRHQNTWGMGTLQDALATQLETASAPAWLDADHMSFLEDLSHAGPSVDAAMDAVNHRLPSDLHGEHTELNMRFHDARFLMGGYGGYGGYGGPDCDDFEIQTIDIEDAGLYSIKVTVHSNVINGQMQVAAFTPEDFALIESTEDPEAATPLAGEGGMTDANGEYTVTLNNISVNQIIVGAMGTTQPDECVVTFGAPWTVPDGVMAIVAESPIGVDVTAAAPAGIQVLLAIVRADVLIAHMASIGGPQNLALDNLPDTVATHGPVASTGAPIEHSFEGLDHSTGYSAAAIFIRPTAPPTFTLVNEMFVTKACGQPAQLTSYSVTPMPLDVDVAFTLEPTGIDFTAAKAAPVAYVAAFPQGQLSAAPTAAEIKAGSAGGVTAAYKKEFSTFSGEFTLDQGADYDVYFHLESSKGQCDWQSVQQAVSAPNCPAGNVPPPTLSFSFEDASAESAFKTDISVNHDLEGVAATYTVLLFNYADVAALPDMPTPADVLANNLPITPLDAQTLTADSAGAASVSYTGLERASDYFVFVLESFSSCYGMQGRIYSTKCDRSIVASASVTVPTDTARSLGVTFGLNGATIAASTRWFGAAIPTAVAAGIALPDGYNLVNNLPAIANQQDLDAVMQLLGPLGANGTFADSADHVFANLMPGTEYTVLALVVDDDCFYSMGSATATTRINCDPVSPLTFDVTLVSRVEVSATITTPQVPVDIDTHVSVTGTTFALLKRADEDAPDANTVVTTGTAGGASPMSFGADGLDPATEYTLYAVAGNDVDGLMCLSAVASTSFTMDPCPVVGAADVMPKAAFAPADKTVLDLLQTSFVTNAGALVPPASAGAERVYAVVYPADGNPPVPSAAAVKAATDGSFVSSFASVEGGDVNQAYNMTGLNMWTDYTLAWITASDKCASTVSTQTLTTNPPALIVDFSSAGVPDGGVVYVNTMSFTATFRLASDRTTPFAVEGITVDNFKVDVHGAVVQYKTLRPGADRRAVWIVDTAVADPIQDTQYKFSFKRDNALPDTVPDSGIFYARYAPPKPVITSALAGTGGSLSASPAVFKVTFPIPVTNFTKEALVVTTQLGHTLAISPAPSATATVWTVTMTMTSTASGSIKLKTVPGAQGVTPRPQASELFTITYAPPTAKLVNATPQGSNALAFKAQFSSAVSGVTVSTFGLSYTDAGNAGSAAISFGSGSSSIWVCTVTLPVGVPNTVVSTIVDGSAGLTPTLGKGDSLSISYAPPALTLSSAQATGGVTHDNMIEFTASFSKPVAGVTAGSFHLASNNGATLEGTAMRKVSSVQYVLSTRVASAPTGTVLSVSMANGESGITPGITGSASSLDITYSPPVPTLSGSTSTSNNVFTVTATFSLPSASPARNVAMAALPASAVTVDAGRNVATVVTASTSDPAVWTITVTLRAAAAGDVAISIASGAAGVKPVPAASSTFTVAYSPVTVALTYLDSAGNTIAARGSAPASGGAQGVAVVRATFSSAVTGVTKAAFGTGLDYVLGQANYANVDLSLNAVSSTVYELTLTNNRYTSVRVTPDIQGLSLTPIVQVPAAAYFDLLNSNTIKTVQHNADNALSLSAGDLAVSTSSHTTYSWVGPDASSADNKAELTRATPVPMLAGNYILTVTVDSRSTSRFFTNAFVVNAYKTSIDAGTPAMAYSGRQFMLSYTTLLPVGSFLLVTVERNGAAVSTITAPVNPTTSLAALQVPVPIPLTAAAGNYRIVATPAAAAVPASTADAKNLLVSIPFQVRTGALSACTHSCGGGVETRSMVCVDISGPTDVPVSAQQCHNVGLGAQLVAQQFSCNTEPCPEPTWAYTPWSACSKACGAGVSTRNATCIGITSEAVDSSLCPAAKKGALSRKCNTFACPTYSWHTGSWGKCNADCDSGTQTRYVACRQTGKASVVADSKCANAGSKPATSRACPDLPSCAQPFYVPGKWSSCSKTCGGGTASRNATCYAEKGVVSADGSACSSLTAPSSSKSCNTQSCFQVVSSPLSECSVECGGGVQTRSVTCMSHTGQVVDVSQCTAAGVSVPALSVACNEQVCPETPFCSATDPCSNHGRGGNGCDEVTDVCDCEDGWTGELCQTDEDCGTGITLWASDNACCPGALNPDGTCCESGLFDDDTDVCCPATAPFKDSCGHCTAETDAAVRLNKVLDMTGSCCAPSQLVAGQCCDGEIDACGVCNGVGFCPRQLSAGVTSSATTLAEYVSLPGFAALVQAIMDAANEYGTMDVEVNPGINARRMLTLEEARQLAATAFSNGISVRPVNGAVDDGIMAALEAAVTSGSSSAEFTVTSTTPASVVPECGNNVCEVGETCDSNGDGDCCVADCPNPYTACPTTSDAAGFCADHGVCNVQTGACACSKGYTGADCADCAAGYTAMGGSCRLAFVAPAPEPEPEPKPVPVPEDPGLGPVIISLIVIVSILMVILCIYVLLTALRSGPQHDELQAMKEMEQQRYDLETPQEVLGTGSRFATVRGPHGGPLSAAYAAPPVATHVVTPGAVPAQTPAPADPVAAAAAEAEATA